MINLEIKNISFSYNIGYNSKIQVLKELNLSGKSGEIIGLIGKNGSGKTTFLNLLKGTLPIQQGKIEINTGTYSRANFSIPLVSQIVDSNLFPTLSVYENFSIIKNKNEHPLKNYFSKNKYNYCKKLLQKAEMNIEDKIDEQIRFLSGGQKQAISILFSLEHELPILLMDEPTASLDPFVSKKVIELAINEILLRKGILILVSHNLQDIINYSTRIVVLKKGKLFEIDKDKIKNEDELMKLM